MGKNKVLQPKILLDADVLIHLFKAERISLLKELYEGRVFMLDIVLDELRNNRTIQANLDAIFLFSGINEIQFPTTSNPQLFQEFMALKRRITGDGERASLIYCKYHSDIIASSNTKDLKPFCVEHDMAYLTTLDILCVAVARGILNDLEADACVKRITKGGGSYLCCSSVSEHRKRHFETVKIGF